MPRAGPHLAGIGAPRADSAESGAQCEPSPWLAKPGLHVATQFLSCPDEDVRGCTRARRL